MDPLDASGGQVHARVKGCARHFSSSRVAANAGRVSKSKATLFHKLSSRAEVRACCFFFSTLNSLRVYFPSRSTSNPSDHSILQPDSIIYKFGILVVDKPVHHLSLGLIQHTLVSVNTPVLHLQNKPSYWSHCQQQPLFDPQTCCPAYTQPPQ